MNLMRCTLCGVSSDVNLALLAKLSMIFPFAEWAVAFRPELANSGRYVSREWAIEFGRLGQLKGIRRVLQLRGDAVGSFIEGDPQLLDLARLYDRAQLHDLWIGRTPDAAAIDRAIAKYGRSVVTPVKSGSEAFAQSIKSPHHEVLFGPISGSRGKTWPAPLAGKLRCGYGGSLGPDNIIAELERIDAVCGDAGVWVVAESKLLDESGRFDLSRAEAFLAAVQSFMLRSRSNVTQLPSKAARRVASA